jgi:hypothetical protein
MTLEVSSERGEETNGVGRREYQRIQIHRNTELEAHIGARLTPDNNSNAVARRDLGRYYAVIARELARMTEIFKEREWLVICEALKGRHFEAENLDLTGLPSASATSGSRQDCRR